MIKSSLAATQEYFDLNVEQAAGLWLNGVAAERLLRCRPLHHPIGLDPEAQRNFNGNPKQGTQE